MPWTDEADNSLLIFRSSLNQGAARQLYLASFYVVNLQSSARQLQQAKEKLDFHNFARSQSCSMIEGTFDSDTHAAAMETAKIGVFAELGNVVSHCYMFLQSLVFAKSAEKGEGWSAVGSGQKLEELLDSYRRARHACLHLPERIRRREFVTDADFSVQAFEPILRFRDPAKGQMDLDFSDASQQKLMGIWADVLALLRQRDEAKGGEIV